MKKAGVLIWIVALTMLLFAGCAQREEPTEVVPQPEVVQPAPQPEEPAPQPEQPAPQPEEPAPQPEQPAPQPEEPAPQPEQPAPQPEEPAPQPEQPAPQPEEPAPQPEEPSDEEKIIRVAVDPGHQRKGNREKEPVGPGAAETKAKVTDGTTGRFSGLPEHALNLAVSLLLRDELEARGYQVILTRDTADVDLSNADRAQIAADGQADIFVRIHANGSEDPSVHGALTVCMTPNNPYCAALYRESRRLSDAVLEGLTRATGAKKRSVWETDTMSGINWASMPVTIVEMGFMTNEEEDLLMATEEYQQKLARGIADGIDAYFGRGESFLP